MRALSLAVVFVATLLWAGSAPPARAQTAYDFTFTMADGSNLPLSALKGRVVLVVNTPNYCGGMNQYLKMQDLWERYGALGLVVVSVPGEDFGRVEPGSPFVVKNYCHVNYGTTFPVTAETSVTGPTAHPFYTWVCTHLDANNVPKWYFHKVLIGRDGQVIAGFNSAEAMESPRIVAAIEAALAVPASSPPVDLRCQCVAPQPAPLQDTTDSSGTRY